MEQGEEGMVEVAPASRDLGVSVAWKMLLERPGGFIIFEDFGHGETRRYGFAQDEIHIVVKGKAEVTWNQPPFKFEEKTVTLEAGDLCFINRWEHLTWKVIEEPYRHLCILMPSPQLPSRDQ